MKAKDYLPPQLADFEDYSDPQLEISAEVEEVARGLDLESWITHRLLHPERELTANIVIVRNDGTPGVFTGYRVQHLTSRGPTVGVVGFSQQASLSAVRASALEGTIQAVLLKLPFGGSAGVVICNPDELSEEELRQISKQYAHALRGVVGRERDVLTPGSGCNEQMIAWMLDSIAADTSQLDHGAATGKPVSMYGLPDYLGMTAAGVITLLEVLVEKPSGGKNRRAGREQVSGSERGRSGLAGLRVSIQGFSAVGASTARCLYDQGAMIVAVSDNSGGIRDQHGINVPELQRYLDEKDVVFGLPDGDPVCNADVLEADCDVLITAAAERQISLANAERIKARVVLELSKWSVTGAAEQLLRDRGTIVVPEILSNAGAAVAAFLEWNQSARFVATTESESEAAIASRVRGMMDSVLCNSEKNGISLRHAAYLIGIDSIANEMRLRR